MHNVDLKDIDISYILSQILLKKIFSKKIKFITKNIITLITFSMLLSAVLAIFSINYLYLYDDNILLQYKYSKVILLLIMVSSIFTIYNAIKLYNKNIYITKSYINNITFSLTKQQCIELDHLSCNISNKTGPAFETIKNQYYIKDKQLIFTFLLYLLKKYTLNKKSISRTRIILHYTTNNK